MTIQSALWHTICLTFAIAVKYQFSDTLELGGPDLYRRVVGWIFIEINPAFPKGLCLENQTAK